MNTMPIVLPSDPLAGVVPVVGQAPAEGESLFSAMLGQVLARWVVSDDASPVGACLPAVFLATLAANTPSEAVSEVSPSQSLAAATPETAVVQQVGEEPSDGGSAEKTIPQAAWEWAGQVAWLAWLRPVPEGALQDLAAATNLKPSESEPGKVMSEEGMVAPVAEPVGFVAKPTTLNGRTEIEAVAPQAEEAGPFARPERVPFQEMPRSGIRTERPNVGRAAAVESEAPVARAEREFSLPASPALTTPAPSYPAEAVHRETEPNALPLGAEAVMSAKPQGEAEAPVRDLRLAADATVQGEGTPRPSAEAKPPEPWVGAKAGETPEVQPRRLPPPATQQHLSGTTRAQGGKPAGPQTGMATATVVWEDPRPIAEEGSTPPAVSEAFGKPAEERPAEGEGPLPHRDGVRATAEMASSAPVVKAKDEGTPIPAPTEVRTETEPALRVFSWAADREPIPEAVSRYLVERLTQAVRRGERECRLELYPKELGKVDARLSFADEHLAVHLKVETPEAQRIVQQALPELRHALEARGVQVGQCDVGLIGYGGAAGRWADPSQTQQDLPQVPLAKGEARHAQAQSAPMAASVVRPRGLVDLLA